VVILFVSCLDGRKHESAIAIRACRGALSYYLKGNGRNLIYLQDDDFEFFLQVLADV
jgi:hypothetical protein